MPQGNPKDDESHLVINGKTYSIHPDDLELGEIEIVEDELDSLLSDVDFNRAKAMRVLSYILIHREDPSFTMDDARKLKISAFGDSDEEPAKAEPAKRPTKAAAAKDSAAG